MKISISKNNGLVIKITGPLVKKGWFLKLITIGGFCSFEVDTKQNQYSSFRVTGFYYRYKFADGSISDPIKCPRFFANCIGGSGVCGWYTLFENVEALSFELQKARFWFFKRYIIERVKWINNVFFKKDKTSWDYIDWQKLCKYKKNPNLTKNEYEEKTLNEAVEAAIKKLKH